MRELGVGEGAAGQRARCLVGGRGVAGRDPVWGEVASAPGLEFGSVGRIVGVAARCFLDRGREVVPRRLLGDLHDCSFGGRDGGHLLDVALRNVPRAVPSPVGAAPGNRRRHRDFGLRRLVAVQRDGGQVVRLGRVGQPVHLGGPAERGEGDAGVVQSCAAAQHQVTAVRVGFGELAARVGVEVQ